jgi:nicotinamidase-related amidase
MTQEHPHRLRADRSALVVVDIQEKLIPLMKYTRVQRMLNNLELMAHLAFDLKMPIFLTEQYPKGLGETISRVKDILKPLGPQKIIKTCFDCWDDPTFQSVIQNHDLDSIIVMGMETHVCVYLTAMSLKQAGYRVFVPRDAVVSSQKDNFVNGLNMLRDSGVLVTNTETIMFQLLRYSGTPVFKKMSERLKNQRRIQGGFSGE